MPATGTVRAWGPYARDILKGSITPETSSRYHAVLTSSSFSPNFDSDQRYSDLTNEVYEGDWPVGGIVLTGVTVSLITASDEIALIHDPIIADEVTLSTFGARIVIVDWTGAADSDRRLAFSAPLSPALSPIAGPIYIASPTGIVRSSY